MADSNRMLMLIRCHGDEILQVATSFNHLCRPPSPIVSRDRRKLQANKLKANPTEFLAAVVKIRVRTCQLSISFIARNF